MKALPLEFRLDWGRRLKEAMAAKGMTARTLAAALETSENNVYRWASGQLPELPEIKRVAKALEVPSGWLLFGEEVLRPFVKGCVALWLGLGLLVTPTQAADNPSPLAPPGLRASAGQLDPIPLIGRWLRRVRHWLFLPPMPGMTLARA